MRTLAGHSGRAAEGRQTEHRPRSELLVHVDHQSLSVRVVLHGCPLSLVVTSGHLRSSMIAHCHWSLRVVIRGPPWLPMVIGVVSILIHCVCDCHGFRWLHVLYMSLHNTTQHCTCNFTTQHCTCHFTTQHCTCHFTTQHCMSLHNTTLYMSLHNTTLYMSLHNTTLYTSLHNTTQHCTCHFTTQHCTCHFTTQHCTCHFTTQHCTRHFTTQHCTCHFTTQHCTCHFTTQHCTCHFTTQHSANISPQQTPVFSAREMYSTNQLEVLKGTLSAAIVSPDRLLFGDSEALYMLDMGEEGLYKFGDKDVRKVSQISIIQDEGLIVLLAGERCTYSVQCICSCISTCTCIHSIYMIVHVHM